MNKDSTSSSTGYSNKNPTGNSTSNRREFLAIAGAGAVAGFAGYTGGRADRPKPAAPLPLAGRKSHVAVVKAASYSHDLADNMLRGIRECGLDV